MGLTKAQLRKLKTTYIPSKTDQIREVQNTILKDLGSLKKYTEGLRDFKHKHEHDLPQLAESIEGIKSKIEAVPAAIMLMIRESKWDKQKYKL